MKLKLKSEDSVSFRTERWRETLIFTGVFTVGNNGCTFVNNVWYFLIINDYLKVFFPYRILLHMSSCVKRGSVCIMYYINMAVKFTNNSQIHLGTERNVPPQLGCSI